MPKFTIQVPPQFEEVEFNIVLHSSGKIDIQCFFSGSGNEVVGVKCPICARQLMINWVDQRYLLHAESVLHLKTHFLVNLSMHYVTEKDEFGPVKQSENQKHLQLFHEFMQFRKNAAQYKQPQRQFSTFSPPMPYSPASLLSMPRAERDARSTSYQSLRTLTQETLGVLENEQGDGISPISD